jgi:protein-disulfide isomerase
MPMPMFRRLALSLLLLLAALPARADDPSPADVAKIQKIIADYLKQHPEVIIDALQEYQKKQDEAKADKARQLIADTKDQLLKDATNPTGGNAKGDITLVEFFDYNCPYCKAGDADLQKAVSADGNVRIVYKEFPILGPESLVAAHAALASVSQGKYQPFHDKLLAYKGHLSEEAIYSIAGDVGLDVKQLKADMQKPEIKDQIDRNYHLADKLNLTGTPAFIIGDILLPGAASADDLTAAFKQARSSSKGG